MRTILCILLYVSIHFCCAIQQVRFHHEHHHTPEVIVVIHQPEQQQESQNNNRIKTALIGLVTTIVAGATAVVIYLTK